MQKKTARFSPGTTIRWAGTLTAMVLLFYLLSRQGWPQIRTSIEQIGFLPFLYAFGLILMSRLMIVGRWYALLHATDVRMPFKDALRLTFVGLFANNFLPSTVGGDVVRLAGAVQAGYDGVITTASLIVDRLVGMAGMALALPVGLYRAFLYEGSLSTWSVYPQIISAGFFPAAAGKYWERGAALVRSLVGRLAGSLKLWARQPVTLLLALTLTLGHMACLFTAYWLLLDGMNDRMPFWLIAGLWSIVYFITLVPVSINGLGVMEVTIAFAFTTLGGAGEASSLILALSYRTLIMLTSLPGALFIAEILPRVRQQAAED